MHIPGNFKIANALYHEAVALGIIPLKNPLDGIEADLRMAKPVNGLIMILSRCNGQSILLCLKQAEVLLTGQCLRGRILSFTSKVTPYLALRHPSLTNRFSRFIPHSFRA
jgi:hypothetical protein